MWLSLITASLAGDLYINDTRVDPRSVAGVVLEKVTVTFDSDGNTRIEAPGYEIKVVDRPGGEPKPAKTTAGVAQAKYWLVSQDLDSSGHTVDVRVNGRRVLTYASGDEQVILDLAEYLKPGANQIVVSSRSDDAGGGALYVFIGEGVDDDGTVKIDKPTVEFGLGPANKTPVERTYTLQAR
ncbi:MAG: hypothetical protein AAF845_18605 [Bacteroidota bacterium]